MKISTTTSVLAGVCPAVAVRSDRRAVNRLAPAFADVSGPNSVLGMAGNNLTRSGYATWGPPD